MSYTFGGFENDSTSNTFQPRRTSEPPRMIDLEDEGVGLSPSSVNQIEDRKTLSLQAALCTRQKEWPVIELDDLEISCSDDDPIQRGIISIPSAQSLYDW
jgi:hypothetical protein